jgi:hypothetical protein
MTEVFKTNVTDKSIAGSILNILKSKFPDWAVNFDLEDCDRILRVKSKHDSIDSTEIINLLKKYGFDAEVLPDEIPSYEVLML